MQRRAPLKNTGTCPKCAGDELLRIPGQAGPFGAGNNIPVGATIFSAVKVLRYVCTTCGFSEEWLLRADLGRLKKAHKTTRKRHIAV